jgi:hypothetical protein
MAGFRWQTSAEYIQGPVTHSATTSRLKGQKNGGFIEKVDGQQPNTYQPVLYMAWLP